MYGSRIVRARARAGFKATAAITNVVGPRIYFGSVPAETAYPYLWGRRLESGIDDSVLAGNPVNQETLRFDISIVIDGRSTAEIETAALAMDGVMAGLNETVDGYQVTAISTGEVPDIDPIFGLEFEQLGRTWECTVTSTNDL